MALRDHITPRVNVPLLDGNSVDVRGLNLDDFTYLLGAHFEQASKIAELYAEHKNSIFSTKPFQEFILSIARDFPGLVTEVISVASDEPDAKDVRLGIGLQIGILNAIVRQTLEEAGGLGNLFAQLRTVGVAALAAAGAKGEPQPSLSRRSTGPGASR